MNEWKTNLDSIFSERFAVNSNSKSANPMLDGFSSTAIVLFLFLDHTLSLSFISSILILLHCVCCYAVIFKSVETPSIPMLMLFQHTHYLVVCLVVLCYGIAIPTRSDQTHSKELSENALAFIFTYIHIRDYVDCVYEKVLSLNETAHSRTQYIFISIVLLVMVRYGNCDTLQKMPRRNTATHISKHPEQ